MYILEVTDAYTLRKVRFFGFAVGGLVDVGEGLPVYVRIPTFKC